MNYFENYELTYKLPVLNDLDLFRIDQEPLLFDLRKTYGTSKKLTVKQRKSKRRAQMQIGKNRGRWTIQQKREYYVFLKIYSQFFVTKELRRNDKVFKMMADFMKTRTPDQCRTHHQKLEARYFRISKILQALKYDFGEIKNQEIIEKCGLLTEPTAPQNGDAEQLKYELENDRLFWNPDMDIVQNQDEYQKEGVKNLDAMNCKIEEEEIIFDDRCFWAQESD